MKYIKPLIIAAALMLTLSSCQLSKWIPQKTENPAETTAPQMSITLPGTESDSVPMDLAGTDLSAYLTLGKYKGLAADEKVSPLTDEEFEAELTKYLSSIPMYEEITNRPTAKGDVIIMDYVGKLDGVAFAGGTAQGQSIELSENSGYIDGFADGLIGVTPGSTVDLTLTFPTDYHAADMAGKTVVFTVTVHYIQGEQITPELTDAFVTEFTGGDYTTVEAFRTFYRNYLDADAAEKAHANALNTLWSAVFENTTFHQVPTEQVSYYHAQLKAQYESYAASYGMSYETILSLYGLTDESLKTQAEQYAKQDLVFYAIVKAESISVTEEEYTAGLADYAASSGVSSAEMEAYYGKDYIMESLLWDEMMDVLYANANITK
jgi:trigger factor